MTVRPTNASTRPVRIIAEVGVNHNGRRDLAFELIDAAADAGADLVKFQTFDARKLASPGAPKAAYQKRATDSAQDQLGMLKALELPHEWHVDLQAHAQSRGIEFISTPFEADSLAFLRDLGIPLLKVPSGELTNAPFLWLFGRAGLPIVLSTGMATLAEVETALAVLSHAMSHADEPPSLDEVWRAWSDEENRRRVRDRVTVLHCTSQYPSPASEINLRAMDSIHNAFGVAVGYSDHSMAIAVPIAAVARGATLIEKHLTLDRAMEGPDHRASLLPEELTQMIAAIREVELALGTGDKVPQPSEWDTRAVARQTIVAARAIEAGQELTRADLTTARCGNGILPVRLWDMVGTRVAQDYRPGDVLLP